MTTHEAYRTARAHKLALKARAVVNGYPAGVHHGELLMMLDEVPTADRDRLYEIQKRAASDYTSRTLWSKTTGPGDRSAHATEIREQIATIAERLWLAAQSAIDELTFGPGRATR